MNPECPRCPAPSRSVLALLALSALAFAPSSARADDYPYSASGRAALQGFLGSVPRGDRGYLTNSAFLRASGVYDRVCADEAAEVDDAQRSLDDASSHLDRPDGQNFRLGAAISARGRCRAAARADMAAFFSRAVLALFEDQRIDAWNYLYGPRARPTPDPVAAFCALDFLINDSGACRSWFSNRIASIAQRRNPDGVWEGPRAGPGPGLTLFGPIGEIDGQPTGLVWTIIGAFGTLQAMPGPPPLQPVPAAGR